MERNWKKKRGLGEEEVEMNSPGVEAVSRSNTHTTGMRFTPDDNIMSDVFFEIPKNLVQIQMLKSIKKGVCTLPLVSLRNSLVLFVF